MVDDAPMVARLRSDGPHWLAGGDNTDREQRLVSDIDAIIGRAVVGARRAVRRKGRNQIMKHRCLLLVLLLTALAAPAAAQPDAGLESLPDEGLSRLGDRLKGMPDGDLAAFTLQSAGYPKTSVLLGTVVQGIRMLHATCPNNSTHAVAMALGVHFKKVAPWDSIESVARRGDTSAEEIGRKFMSSTHLVSAKAIQEMGCPALGGSGSGGRETGIMRDFELARFTLDSVGYPATPMLEKAAAQTIRMIHGTCPNIPKDAISIALALEYNASAPWSFITASRDQGDGSVEEIAQDSMTRVHWNAAAMLKDAGCPVRGGSESGNEGDPHHDTARNGFSDHEFAGVILDSIGYPKTPILVAAVTRGMRTIRDACPELPKASIAAALSAKLRDYDQNWSDVVSEAQGVYADELSAEESASITITVNYEYMGEELKASGCHLD